MEIKIYDDIYEHGYGVNAISNDLERAGGEDVHVKIHSGGGLVFTGLGIYDLLSSYEGEVTTEIVGLAGSMASVIFMAGDKRIVNSGFLMIHSPWTMTAGNAEELKEDIDLLEKMRDQLISIYEKTTGQNREVLEEKMKKDSYMTAEELLELGFVTEVKEGAKLVASIQNLSNKQLKKEPQMAMTKEEKAEFEALKAENQDLKTQVEAKLEADKAEIDAKIQEGVEAGIKAEKEREADILALMIDDRQKEFASSLVASGKSVAEASLALNKHFKENKGEYAKLDKDVKVDTLVAQAPKPSQEQEVKEEKETKEQIHAQIKALKEEGDYKGANKLYDKLEGIK